MADYFALFLEFVLGSYIGIFVAQKIVREMEDYFIKAPPTLFNSPPPIMGVNFYK